MRDRYGPWAVIAGGSEGIGAEIGNVLAASGINVCMVARNAGALQHQADHLRTTFGVDVVAQPLDLSDPGAVEAMIALTEPYEVGFYAHVASYAPLDRYLDTSPRRHEQALRVNVVSAHQLTYHFSTLMSQRGRGGIVLCSSMASLSPFPNNAQYAADKAYVRMLGEALWFELRAQGIDVLTLTISEVSTPALLRSGSKLQGKGTLTPRQVVDEAFAHLGKKPGIVTGRRNRVLAFAGQHLVPKRVMMSVLAKQIANYHEAIAEH
jgi:uncharacterized protein